MYTYVYIYIYTLYVCIDKYMYTYIYIEALLAWVEQVLLCPSNLAGSTKKNESLSCKGALLGASQLSDFLRPFLKVSEIA